MNKKKSSSSMLHLALAIMAVVLLAACGGSGGDGDLPEPTGDGTVSITCMDVKYTQAADCNGTQEAQFAPQRAADAIIPIRGIYNAGDIITGTNIYAQAEVTNRSPFAADIYFYTEFNKDGVFNNNTAQTYKINVAAGDVIDAHYGSNPCPDAGPCVNAGDWEYVTYIYNAAHLAEEELGDPANDEIFAGGILKFTLVSP